VSQMFRITLPPVTIEIGRMCPKWGRTLARKRRLCFENAWGTTPTRGASAGLKGEVGLIAAGPFARQNEKVGDGSAKGGILGAPAVQRYSAVRDPSATLKSHIVGAAGNDAAAVLDRNTITMSATVDVVWGALATMTDNWAIHGVALSRNIRTALAS
jgi:hypothetical protein